VIKCHCVREKTESCTHRNDKLIEYACDTAVLARENTGKKMKLEVPVETEVGKGQTGLRNIWM
jgi:hypothetical protein